MFTGIVVEQGVVRRADAKKGRLDLEIEAPRIAHELEVGDSVAVNGVCLTATAVRRKRFSVTAMAETESRSTVSTLSKGHKVNLELAARLSDRLGGHLVQGHVDAVATLIRSEDDGDARRFWFTVGSDVLRYMVPKGSVTLDGVSLTIVDVGETSFEVALIPHTLGATTLGRLKVGSAVNVEADVIAKYVERLTRGHLRVG